MKPCLRILPLVLVLGACTVPDLDLAGLACDEAHPCTTGFVCLDGACVAEGEKGPDDCSPEETRECGSGLGECRKGVQRCGPAGKFLEACEGEVAATAEVCDGKDNDCDDAIDEELAPVACEKTKGVCAGAVKSCTDGKLVAACGAAEYGVDYEADEATCDGKDNDCDGDIDEGVSGALCELQQGVCAGARQACQGGALEQSCSAATYSALSPDYQEVESTCDGLDNDCDGKVDNSADDADGDGYGATGAGCLTGNDCDDTDPARSPALTEICDGKDNDCDNTRDEGFTCAKGDDSGPCTSTCGTAGRILCNDTCSGTSCVPPAEICNGKDEDCVAGEDNGLISGPILLGGADARFPAIVGRENGGFTVHYVSQSKNQSELELVSSHFRPDATLGGNPTSINLGGASVKALAASSHHVAWIEQGQGSAQSIEAAYLGTRLDVSATAGSGYSYLDAHTVGATSFLAWQETTSAAPLAPELGIAVLTGGAVTRTTSIKPAAGIGYGAPTFGQVGSNTVLYYVRTDSTGQKIAVRDIDGTGTPGAEMAMVNAPPTFSAVQPAAARDALVFAEVSGTSSSVMLARIQSGGCGGNPYCLGPGVTVSQSGTFAERPSIAYIGDDTYLVTWLELINFDYIIHALRIHWDAANQKWGGLTSQQGLDFRAGNRSVVSVKAAHDGNRFALAFDTLDTSGNYEVYVRNTCP